MPNYADLDHASIRHTVANHCYSKPGLAIDGTNAENVQTSSAIIGSIAGVMYTLATQAEIDVSALPVLTEAGATTTMSAQAINTDRIYLLLLDTSAAIKVVQGTAVATGAECRCPSCPEGHFAWGAIKVANADTAPFTFGTTSLSATGVTDTYYDLAIAPASL